MLDKVRMLAFLATFGTKDFVRRSTGDPGGFVYLSMAEGLSISGAQVCRVQPTTQLLQSHDFQGKKEILSQG